MTRNHFRFIWRHFHVYSPPTMYDDDDAVALAENEDDNEDEELVDQMLECV